MKRRMKSQMKHWTKKSISDRWLFALGFVILVVTNIIMITGVASNRSGEPESRIELTHRELVMPYRIMKENSGLSLHLKWRSLGIKPENADDDYYRYSSRFPEWFNKEKLKSLGFQTDLIKKPVERYRKQIPKEVFIVLELDGPPYREAVLRAEKAFKRAKLMLKKNPENKDVQGKYKTMETRLKNERESASRLFAIDAGLDPEKLRKHYNDRLKYIIAKAIVEPSFSYTDKKSEPMGFISSLSVENIYVALKFKKIFDSFKQVAPKFTVEIAYGSRHEPWVLSVNEF